MLWRLTGAALAVIVITSVTIVAADFYRHWQKRRSVGQIPLIHDGSWLSPSLQWRRPSFDAESEMARAYKKVRYLLNEGMQYLADIGFRRDRM